MMMWCFPLCERECETVCRGSPDAPEEPEGPLWDLWVDSGEKQVQQHVKTHSNNTSRQQYERLSLCKFKLCVPWCMTASVYFTHCEQAQTHACSFGLACDSRPWTSTTNPLPRAWSVFWSLSQLSPHLHCLPADGFTEKILRHVVLTWGTYTFSAYSNKPTTGTSLGV